MGFTTRKQYRGLDREIYDGMSVYRLGEGPALESLCAELATLEPSFPGVEIRRPGRKKRSPTIHLLNSLDIRTNEATVGHLVLSQVINRIFHDIPSLGYGERIEVNAVYSETVRSGARFVMLHTNEEDEQRLYREREAVAAVIDEMAGVASRSWRNVSMDMTIAFIPANSEGGIVEPVMEITRGVLPITIPLSSARY